MAEDRGRVFRDKLEAESNEYAALHSIFKKLLKSEESIISNRHEFRERWESVANIERDESLAALFHKYSGALGGIQNAQSNSLEHLSRVILEALRLYPLRIKKQRRSLSRRNRSEKNEPERGKSASRSDSLDRDKKIRKAASSMVVSDKLEENQETEISIGMEEFELDHMNEMKNILLHLLNAQMYYHSQALQILSDIFPNVMSNAES